VTTKTARYYHFLGKENTWTDFLSPFIPSSNTDTPGEPQDNFRYDLHVRRDILGTKLISPSDVSYVVPRIDWTYNMVFDMYDDNIGPVSLSGTTAPSATGKIKLEEARFYVLTSEFNVYKCIDNNYGAPSLIQPVGTDSNTFTTSDGYIWKFMYTIPISLRNRFLSVEWMPVTTALKSQFYSNGAITSLSIDSPGSNYVTEVIGAGAITTLNNSLTVTGTNTLFTSQVLPGYIIKTLAGNQIGIVSVVNSDTSITLTANASVTISTAASFKISPPTPAYAVVTGVGYPEKNPYTITGITGAPSGVGYRVSPSISISAPKIISGSELQATASLTISGGIVNTATLVAAGYGYDTSPNAPVITVDPPMGASPAYTGGPTYAYWAGSTVYGTLGAVLQFGGRFYRVTQTGTSSTTGPSHSTGEVTNGSAKLTYIGPDNWVASTPYAQYTILKHENRYYTVTNASGTTGTTGPTGIVAGTSETNGTCNMVYFGTQAILSATIIKNTASLTPIISNGQVTGIIINDGGIGFTGDAKIQILDSNHQNTNVLTQDSTYAKISANFSVGNVDTLQANVELLAKKGTIEVIKMVDQGSNYSSATVEILGDGGLGNDEMATAKANIVNGKIVSIKVLTKGTGYTWTDVVITGNGTGAVARAVMSPLNGHGYDAIDELNANSLSFYSSFSQVKNQGLLINNDYRKAGLLRNINYFNSTKKYDKVDGSGCILITGKFDSSKLAYDMLLFKQEPDNNNYKKYRIVEFTSTQILLSVFNNFTISANDILLTTSKIINPDGSISEPLNGNIIAVDTVSERTIDQFSGDMLFLTVRESFQPSEEQTISIRTVVTV
jgi:hypothetical protein